MKRLVREIITLLKIERWLLDEGGDHTIADHTIAASGEHSLGHPVDQQGELTTIEQIHLLPDGLSATELAAFLATYPPADGSRILTQRIVQVSQQDSNQS